jgi:uncharacterized protein (DUF924 family)
MTGDLEAAEPQVHDAAVSVLRFWFEEVDEEKHWTRSITLDQAIGERFGQLRDQVKESAGAGWRATPDALLAAVILLDQFSRNIHRDEAETFAADPIARELALFGMLRGDDLGLPPDRRVFLYMPLMHAEDRMIQRLSIEKFTALGDQFQLGFARGHAEVVERFGRFPSRNAILKRRSTALEKEYLSQPGVGW